MRATKTAEEIEEILKNQKESGLTQKKFCKENFIKHSTFSSWLAKQKKKPQTGSGDFIKIPSSFSAIEPTTFKQYQLELGDNTLIVPVGFNISEVKVLVNLLSC